VEFPSAGRTWRLTVHNKKNDEELCIYGTSKNYIFQGLRQRQKWSLLKKMNIWPTESNEEKEVFRSPV
jgi:hypothetical protein